MSFKPVRVLYSSRNFLTGLSDVKATVEVNGVSKVSLASALVLSEVDATNFPGTYALTISAAQQVTWGVANGDAIQVRVNSATQYAPSFQSYIATSISTDDLDAHLSTQDTSIAAIKTELDTVNTTTASTNTAVTAIKSDVEDPTTGLAALKTAITSVSSQISNLQNNTNFSAFVPQGGFVKPATGSQVYRIPINTQNSTGALIDPDSSTISVSIVNPAGVDQGNIMTGYTSGTGGNPGTAPAVRDSMGNYHIDVTIPSTAVEQELLFSFSYAISTVSYVKKAAANVTNNVQADGFATQATLLNVQTTTNDTNTRVIDVQSYVENATYGLSAANVIQTGIKTQTDKLGDATIGLAAIKADVDSGNTTSASILTFLQTNVFLGGKIF